MRKLILCYHAISAGWTHPLAVRPEAFARQLRLLLRSGYRPAPLPELLAADGGQRLFHVSFDDAYRSVARVLPLLERLAVPATVFACPRLADSGAPLAVPELQTEAARHPDELATMDWRQLRELAGAGVEIGAHTLTHPHLPTLPDAELHHELRAARLEIEDQLGRPCRYVAYPYGECDARARAAAAAAGYAAAFTQEANGAPRDRFNLPRVSVYRDDSLLRVALKLTPALGLVERGRALRSRLPSPA